MIYFKTFPPPDKKAVRVIALSNGIIQVFVFLTRIAHQIKLYKQREIFIVLSIMMSFKFGDFHSFVCFTDNKFFYYAYNLVQNFASQKKNKFLSHLLPLTPQIG